MDKFFLGVDTSNYTTSLCISDGKKIISEQRQLLPVKDGEQGLRQSDALFHHTKALPELCKRLFDCAEIDKSKICAVGVSSKPRDAEGSYMPCFLAGVSFATAISCALSVPLYEFSHQSGHISAAAISGNCMDILNNDFISFHVSGGTTEVLHVSSLYDGLKCEIIGGTKDLNAGQAIDRCGVAMGLHFPCGAEMDRLSLDSQRKFSPKVSVLDGYCNLSGLENMCKKMISDGKNISDICKFTFSYIAKTLYKLSENIRLEYPSLPILYAGGVMSNSYIRDELSKIGNVHFALPKYSCDNALGISALTCYRHNNNLII
ncbi:MAG: peptidase M22 [Clostridia bacterium]|nr:peptidase M22 [Clostridia bacterium]